MEYEWDEQKNARNIAERDKPEPNAEPIRLSEAELARIDARAKQGGATYYEDIPEMDEEFFKNAPIIYPEDEEAAFAGAATSARGTIQVDLAPDVLTQMKTEAEREGMGPSTLIRKWVLERLNGQVEPVKS